MSEQLSLFGEPHGGQHDSKSCFRGGVSEQPPEKRSLTDSVSEQTLQKRKAIERYLNNGSGSATACINKYKAGNRANHYYYRLSYRISQNKVKHCHIPGGNTYAYLANHRASMLQQMIDRGADVTELLSAIADYRGKSAR